MGFTGKDLNIKVTLIKFFTQNINIIEIIICCLPNIETHEHFYCDKL